MVGINKLIGLKNKAQKDGWSKYIRTPADENALLNGYTFSLAHYDMFRFYVENFLVLSKGKWAGKPMTIMEFQDEICGSLFGWINKKDGMRRFRRGYVEIGKKNSKALALDTLIPTPKGFTELKNITVGDTIFACDGTQTKVIAESEIFNHNKCYVLIFENDEKVFADAEHLWQVKIDEQVLIKNTKAIAAYINKSTVEIPQYHSNTNTIGFVRIKIINEVKSVPTKCIAIDHPSKLFLITKSFLVTHNTTTAAAIGLYMLDGDGEPSAEVFNVANDRDQASILWTLSADMVEMNTKLNDRMEVLRSTKKIIKKDKKGTSIFSAWSSDQSSKDGPNIHCAIIDELHEWKGGASREFWRKIRYGGIARAQPLCPLVITTAGDDKHSLCFEQHTYARKILDGVADQDFSYFACIYGVDQEKIRTEPDYWKTEEAWKSANPAYEIILKKEDFEADVVEAENDPTSKMAFLRYRLGYWIESSSPWIEINKWDSSAKITFEEADLKGQICFAGVDLSSVEDFTAVSYVFPYRDEATNNFKYKIICRTYVPEDRLRDRIKKLDVNFLDWVNRGWIRMTPGNSIDHEFIFQEIKADSEVFNIKELAYDRFAMAWIIQQLQKELPHIELFPISQSTGMSNPTKALYSAIMQERIEHNHNPVLKWAVSNAIPDTDRHGNIHLHKGKSKDKIDPLIATIMGFAQAQLGELTARRKSFYDDDVFEKNMLEIEGVDIKKFEAAKSPVNTFKAKLD